MVWPYLEMPEIYFITQAIFEVGVLFYAIKKTPEKSERTVLNFFLGISVYALLKETVFNPIKLDLSEYYGFGIGVLFVIIQIAHNNGRSITRDK